MTTELKTEVDREATCAFQYYARGRMVEDTGLITREEAETLWQNHKEDFKRMVEDEEEAEMALWVEMADDTNYHKTAKNMRADECVMRQGIMFRLESAF